MGSAGTALKGAIILPTVPPPYATNRLCTGIQQEALVRPLLSRAPPTTSVEPFTARTTRVVASTSTASSVATYAALARAGNNTSPAQSANVVKKLIGNRFWPSGALARS